MKVGDLVRFKDGFSSRLYGVGVLLHEKPGIVTANRRHWALFNNERIMVRLNELELISESR